MQFAVDLQNKTGKSYLSYSSIKIALEDMVSFEAYCRGTYYKDSDALTFGSAYDCLLFEPEKFDERFAVMNDSKIIAEIGGGNPRITKAYKEWKKEFSETLGKKRILSMEENQRAVDMITRLMRTNAYDLYLADAQYQVEATGFIGDIPVHGFLDAKGSAAFGDYVVDVKSTRSVKGFRRDVFTFGYDLQAYIYTQLTGVSNYVWIVQQSSYPYTIGLYVCSERTLESGKRKFDTGVDLIHSFLDGDIPPQEYYIFEEI
jgi:hypothetical protein